MYLSRFESLGLLSDEYVGVRVMRTAGQRIEWDTFGLTPEHATVLFDRDFYFVHRGSIRIDAEEGRMFVEIDKGKWARRYCHL